MVTQETRRFAWLNASVMLYLFAVSMVAFALDGGVYTVLMNLFLVRLNYGPEQIGLINSVGTFVFALSSLPAGVVGERWGSRRTMLVGLVLMALSGTLFPLADALALNWRFPWLVGNIAVLYFGLALFFVNTAPYVLELVGPNQGNAVISLQTATMSLCAFVGSLLGGFLPPLFATWLDATLSMPVPYRYALMLGGLAMLPALFALLLARPAAPRAATASVATAALAQGSVLAAPLLGLLLTITVVRMLQVAGIGAVNTFNNVYLDTQLLVPTAEIGLISAAARLIGVPAALSTAFFTRRFGNRGVVIGASIASALCILPIALLPNVGAAAFTVVSIIGLSWIRYGSSLVFFLELVPPQRRAVVSGVTEMAGGVCFTAVTFGGGYLIASYGYQSLFLLSAIITGLSALVFWLAFRKPRT
jgi:MFS family permease